MVKQTKVITRRKKFQEVEIPLTKSKIELIGNTIDEMKDKTIKLDLTRQLRGKSVEIVVKVDVEKDKLVANPVKMKLLPYFIRRMIRKKISYIEDSFQAPSQESMLVVKPFLITRKRVSRVVRKTLRNKARNWLEDYISQKKDNEIFNEILTNKMQKPLSLVLKKTYPLSLCEIRVLEIKRSLEKSEVPKKVVAKKVIEDLGEEVIDQMKEIEDEKIKQAQEDIKKTQVMAAGMEKEDEKQVEKEVKEIKEKVKDEKDSSERNKEKSVSEKNDSKADKLPINEDNKVK